MRLNRFVFLLASTVAVGAFFGVLTSATGWWIHVYWFTGLIEGAFLATTSLMGFWAYLTLNFIARVTLPRRVWRWFQVLFLFLVVFDMFYWRYHADFVRHPLGTSYGPYLIQALWPLILSIAGAYLKSRQSGSSSFLPSLFFLYVFTVVDWLLVIWLRSDALVNQTGLIMMACNLYMLLLYGRLLTPPAELNAKLESIAASRPPTRAERKAALAVRKASADSVEGNGNQTAIQKPLP